MAELNDKQKRFIDEYLKDFNVTQSAIRAGYSKRSAPTTGWRLLRNENIQKELSTRKKQVSEENGVTMEKVLRQYAKIAFGDIKEIVMWDENGRMILNNPRNVDGTIIDGIEASEHGLKIKRSDRMKALEMLAKYTGMLDERQQTSVDVTQYINALTGTARNVWGGDDGTETE